MVTPFSNPFYVLSPLAALVVSCILIIIIILKGRRSAGSWLFIYLLFGIGLWSFLLFGMRASTRVEDAIVWAKVASIPAIATFVFFYHFTIGYTKTQKQNLYLLAAYLLLLGIGILSPTSLIIKDMRIEVYGYAPVQGELSIIISFLSIPLLGGGIYNLVKAYRTSKIYEERNRILYLLIAIIFPVTGALLDATTNLPPMLVWCQVIFVLICSVAILKYHLLDIRIVFRKGIAYLIISTIVAVPYGIIIFILSRIIDLKTEAWWYHALIILLLSIALQPLQQWAQRLVDKLFYRERYNHLMTLEKLSRETQSILNIDELCSKLMISLSGALRISKGCLLLRSDDNDGFVMNYCTEMSIIRGEVIFKKNSLLVNWLNTQGNVITSRDFHILPYFQNLTSDEKNIIDKLDARLFVPIRIQGQSLSGILALGDKVGQGSYSIEDRQFISTIANQMAISLENARLYNSEKHMRETYEQMDIQKTEFLHSVAYELKTPLTAILSSSEILEEKSPQNEEIRQRLYGNIKRSADIINRRVTDLLELAQMQIGEIKMNISLVDTASLINDSVSQLLFMFTTDNQILTLDVPENLPVINADKDKLQQVLFNLLSNANKYSPSKSRILLKASQKSGNILIQVFDKAEPISADIKEKLFSPYFLIDDYLINKDSLGLGLNLAISKKFIDLHNGSIWIEENPDGGNILSFTIPFSE